MRVYLPSLVLLLFGAWAGTLDGGAGFAGSVVGAGVLLASALTAAIRGWVDTDPLGLGRAGRWLLGALLLAVLASWWASPVPRAGRVGLLLLPACLLLPSVVEAVWRDASARRRGLRVLAAGVAALAAWSLVGPLSGGFPRAAAPLGHHNLLALWLLTVLPLAVMPAREGGGWRWLGGVAGVLGAAAVLATRSLLGAAGLAVLVVLTLAAPIVRGRPVRRRFNPWMALGVVAAGLILALVLVAGPRLMEIGAGRDPSAQARTVYWRAGLAGFLERPLLGWGPGATPWTVGAFLRPEPGVNPPGEVVGQLHSQPLQLLYELGAPGLALVLAVVALFVLRRIREVRIGGARDPVLALAGVAGLAATGVAFVGTAALDIPAIPVAVAVVVGAARAGGGAGPRTPSPVAHLPGRLCVGLYVLVASVLLVPVSRAHLHYQRALGLDRDAAAREMATAVALDPSFPWYRAWSAWLGGAGPLARRAAAEPALEAARGAPGIAPLWLTAGVYGLEADAPWADAALAHACRLDPLGPLAPFYRMRAAPDSPRAPHCGARALLAEPRLLAAVFWDRQPELRAAALAEVAAWPGVPEGWREAFRQAARTTAGAAAETGASRSAGLAHIATTLDREPVASVALHAFRRRSRPLDLVPVTVHRQTAEAIDLPAASILRETSTEAFGAVGCSEGSAGGSRGPSPSTGAAENLVENR